MLVLALEADAARFLALQLAKNPDAIGIRLAVAPAGCSGLRYRVEPVDAVREDDVIFDSRGLLIVVDGLSLRYTQGTTVRLAQEGLARRLRSTIPMPDMVAAAGKASICDPRRS